MRDLRNGNDLSQKNVAKIIKTTQQQYSKYKKGARIIPIDKLNILVNYYNTSVDYLIGRINIIKQYLEKSMKK